MLLQTIDSTEKSELKKLGEDIEMAVGQEKFLWEEIKVENDDELFQLIFGSV
jgi:hypothetical protein